MSGKKRFNDVVNCLLIVFRCFITRNLLRCVCFSKTTIVYPTGRLKKLRETLVAVQQLDKNMISLRSWLTHIETELSRPILYDTCDSQEIQRKLDLQQVNTVSVAWWSVYVVSPTPCHCNGHTDVVS